MAQVEQFEWTNPSSAVARNLDCGFSPAKVEVWDLTTPNKYSWTSNMGDGNVYDETGDSYITSNGVTALNQGAQFWEDISNITNANPAVITVPDTNRFTEGDTIPVTGVADDGAGTTLNGEYTIASLTSTEITTATDTSSGYSAYVSGGMVYPSKDSDGNAIPTENKGIRGVTLGTSAVGANSATMKAIVYSEEPVT